MSQAGNRFLVVKGKGRPGDDGLPGGSRPLCEPAAATHSFSSRAQGDPARLWKLGIASAALLIAVLATYANHFHNSFHFDDSHAVVDNPYIRDWKNIPRFFTDATTFSVLPTNQSYRPIVSTTLALDYHFGKGLKPFYFHLSTFVVFLVLIALMYALFVGVLGRGGEWTALFAAALFALHPVSAETVNYIVQRGDLYSTLGVVAGMAAYVWLPGCRRYGLYLLPALLGMLAKPSALVFAPILLVYLLLSEASWKKAAVRWVPAFLLCGAYYIFQSRMTPGTYVGSFGNPLNYWLTQPYVALRYFVSFFLPLHLSADTDLAPLESLWNPLALCGFLFIAAIGAAAILAAFRRQWRPVSFGLWWFLIGLIPTAVVPLAEVENDHRMFLPFVGLALAVSASLLIERFRIPRYIPAGIAIVWLAALGWGTHVRNEVWRTEETLWRDVTEKSPRNGRGLMNYGLTQLSKGNPLVAYDYFQRAKQFTPNYSVLEINLGVVSGVLRRNAEAERHFQRAITLAPSDNQSYSLYGRWLLEQGRMQDASAMLTRAAALNLAALQSRYLLMDIYARQADWESLERIADSILSIAPADPQAQRYAGLARAARARASSPRQLSAVQATPEYYLNLSLSYFQAGRFEECIGAAKEALRLRPGYPEAFNNIAAAYQSMGRWDDAIAAAKVAIRLKPDFQLARNNLAWSISQKSLAKGR